MSKNIQKVLELSKIMKDTPYALKTYLQTYDNTQKKFVPLELFPDQIQLIKDYETYNENITRKYRQAGVSTVTAAWISKILQFANKDKPERVLIIANKRDTAIEMANKVRSFLEQWPDWLNVGFSPDKNAESRFKLNNGCEVKAVATSADALRGYTPTILVFDEAAYIEAGEDFWAASMASLSTGGKIILISCVTKDTYIFTSNGLQQLSDFINEDKKVGEGYFIENYKVFGKDKLRESNILLNNGFQKTKKITTIHSSLEGTLTHKVWAYSNNKKEYGWYQLSELQKDDYINVGYGMNVWGNNDKIDFNYTPTNKESNIFIPNELTNDICYFLGLFISEGSIYEKFNNNNILIGSTITITCGDDISEILNKLNLKYYCGDKIHYNISSISLLKFLKYIGFDTKSKAKNKIIPKRLLSLSKEKTKFLLRGIFDGDGFADSKRNRVGIGLSSIELIKQIKMLLLNFGILTDYNEVNTKPTKKVSVYSKNYRITTSSIFTQRFFEEIGFGFERKQNNRQIIKVNKNSYDYIPNGSKILLEIINDEKIKRKNINKNNHNNWSQLKKTKNLSRDSFYELYNEISVLTKNKYDDFIFEKILINNSKWDKIKNIEDSENNTYDFSLYENKNDFWCHSIYYNGYLGHQTPNGFDPIYYGVYDQAIRGINDFHITDLRWFKDPRYTKDLKWVKVNDIVHYMLNREQYNDDEIIYNITDNNYDYVDLINKGYKPYSSWFESMAKKFKYDKRKISQELECDFLGSGDSVISSDIITNITKNMIQPPIEKYMQGTLWVWKEPIHNHRYILGADVSRGDSEDFSSINIIDFDEQEQVVEYIGKIPPDDLASIIYKWGKLYGDAFVVIDITGGMGVATSRKLQEYNYKNIYIEGINTQNVWEYNSKLMDKIPGLNFNNKRVQIIAAFEEHLRNGFIIHSDRLLNELNTFVYINGRPDHMKGAHDDSIMSLSMGLYISEICFKNLQKNDSINKALLDSWVLNERTYDTNQSFNLQGQLINPLINMTSSNEIFHAENPINIPKNAYKEYYWLFNKKK